MKPIKRGYKLWCRSDMSGYIYQFDVYQGKKKDESAESSKRCKSNVGLGGTVVQERSLIGKNHIIMMDNYFSSPLLFEQLKADSIYACGTVRSNREGLPNLTSDKKMKRGIFILEYQIKVCSS